MKAGQRRAQAGAGHHAAGGVQGIFTASVDMDRLLAGDGGADTHRRPDAQAQPGGRRAVALGARVVQPTSGAGAGASLDSGRAAQLAAAALEARGQAAIRRAYDIFCHELQHPAR